MGTFHHDRHELHGMTVVVETTGSKTFVGRCDDIDDRGAILLDGDVHDAAAAGRSKDEFLERAARFGIWKSFERAVVPAGEIAGVRRLADVPRS